MTNFDKLVMGGGGGGRKRRAGPPTRPPFLAHPCTDWSDEHVKEHLAACSRARDETGEWVFTTDDSAAAWAWLWETMGKERPDGSMDFSPWSVVEVEVP